jgi:hypothetical protein
MKTITFAPLRSPRPGGAQPYLPVWLTPNKEDKSNIQDGRVCGLTSFFRFSLKAFLRT